MSSPEEAVHGLARLPEISATNTDPGLLSANLVKIQVTYPCKCGVTVRTSETIQEEVVVRDVDAFAAKVRQITAQSRDRWEEHLRG
ncbi:hypothetical protein PBI_MORRISSEY_61 [Gordonia phage Morrissey]|nr:hypothetical protein PBI_MORRISSEY_61 [Gordonia phage Morrissey]